MTCAVCTFATTKSVAGGTSTYRRAMWRFKFCGCKLDRSEATTYSVNYKCAKFSPASAEQLGQRK